jgi:hypothetical protein
VGLNLFYQEGELYSTRIRFRWQERPSAACNRRWDQKPAVDVDVYRIGGKFDVTFGGAPVYSQMNNKVVGIFAAKDKEYDYAIPIDEIVHKFKSVSITSPP